MTAALILTATVAGGLGAGVRFLAVRFARRPALILVGVNAVASFLAGGVAGGTGTLIDAALNTALIAGLCGGMSSWSSYLADTLRLWRAGQQVAAVALLLFTPLLGIAAAGAGLELGQGVVGAR